MATVIFYPTKEETAFIKDWLLKNIKPLIGANGSDIKKEIIGAIPEMPRFIEICCDVTIEQEWEFKEMEEGQAIYENKFLSIYIGQVFALDKDGQDYSFFMDNTDLENINLYLNGI